MSGATGVTPQTIDVKLGDDTFTFKVPTIRFDMEVSYRAAAVRRRAVPESSGFADAIDNQAFQFSRFAAMIELYLTAATVEWPWSPGADGKPVVDVDKFPLEHLDDVYGLGAGFEAEMSRFRRPRVVDPKPAPP